jgi:hypothetical protein
MAQSKSQRSDCVNFQTLFLRQLDIPARRLESEISSVPKVSIITTIRSRHAIVEYFGSLDVVRTFHRWRSLSANALSSLAWSLRIHPVRRSSESRVRSLVTLRMTEPRKYAGVASQCRKDKSCLVQYLGNMAVRGILLNLLSATHWTDFLEL